MFNFDWLSVFSQENMQKWIFLSLYESNRFFGCYCCPQEYIYEGIAKEDRHVEQFKKLWSISCSSLSLDLSIIIFNL